ncbi:zinc finger domain-containing protein [Paramyrothecium foliicola]|nr:zinc finger domain-containing protein [Paramyrothecium foliicola]
MGHPGDLGHFEEASPRRVAEASPRASRTVAFQLLLVAYRSLKYHKPHHPKADSCLKNSRGSPEGAAGLSAHRASTPSEKQPQIDSTPPRPTSTRPGVSPSESVLEKRRRLEASGTARPTSSHSTSEPTVTVYSTPKKPIATPSVPVRSEAAAKFCPSDRAELLRRLATFQDITDWTPKPDKVNEVEWAKRGWICQGKERVGCVLCRKELVVKLNRKELDGKEVPVLVSSEIESALVDKYSQLIIDSHREDCLWRRQGCDASTKATVAELRQRYDELCARKPFLPYEFNLRLPEGLDLDQILQQLPPDFFSEPAPTQGLPTQAPNRVAFALALFGWQGLTNTRIGAVPNSASCHTCLRRLGLWMFKSKEVDEHGQVLVPAPMDYLDPVREHRFFCPWKNGLAQSRTGASTAKEPANPGWRILLQTLKNEAHLRSVLEAPKFRSPRGVRGHNPAVSLPNIPINRVNPSSVQAQDESSRDTGHDPAQSELSIGDTVEDEKEREAKDKERWARLRRVKSLFEAKGSRRNRRPISRPGTGQSTVGEATVSSEGQEKS